MLVDRYIIYRCIYICKSFPMISAIDFCEVYDWGGGVEGQDSHQDRDQDLDQERNQDSHLDRDQERNQDSHRDRDQDRD